MARIEHVTLLLQYFDDMESVRSLYDLRYHTRLQSHSRIRECRPEDRLRCHAELTAFTCTARVLRIDSCQSREFFTIHDSFTDGKKSFLYCKVGSFAVRIDTDLAELIFDRNHRKVLSLSCIHILLHVIWSKIRNLSRNLLLHLLGQGLVLEIRTPLLTEAVYRLSELLLHSFLAAEIGLEHVDSVCKLALDHIVVHYK